MKSLIVFAVFFPVIASAAGYGGAEGKNRRGEIIRIGGDIPDTIYVQKNKKDLNWKEQYSLAKECPAFTAIFEGKRQFSCNFSGKSPLAGTTYKVTTLKSYKPCDEPPYNDKSPGIVYLCVAGCDDPRVPKLLYESPWEC